MQPEVGRTFLRESIPMTNLVGPSRRALIIGIDTCLGAPPLRGCANDAMLMTTILRQLGFHSADIHLLLDHDATRKAIDEALETIRSEAGASTSVFLYFSGWGARVPRGSSGAPLVTPWASSGSSMSEPDMAYDSALLPHDWTEPSVGSALRYDDLRAWLSALPTRKVMIILDAPYSGTLLGEAPAGSGPIYLGASRTDEICFELVTDDGVAHGGLTYFLSQALLRPAPGLTYRRAFEQVSARVASRLPHQHPQMEGGIDQLVFGSEGQAPAGAIVSARNEEVITLDIGAAAGVTTRSWWAVYPEVDGDGAGADKLGMVEIVDVSASEARARILSEVAEGSIRSGARAVEEQHDYGDMRLRVGIEAPAAGDDLQRSADMLRDDLSRVELLRVVHPDERRDVLVRLVPAGAPLEIDVSGAVVRASEPMWLVEDDMGSGGGGRAMQSRPLFRPCSARSPYDVRLDLEKLSRYRNMLSLVNPNPRSPLAGKVELVLSRRDPGGEWADAKPDPRTGLPVLHEGDHVLVDVINHHDRDIYASLFDFGVSMSIAALTEGAALIPAGATVSLFSDVDHLEMFFPGQVPGSSGMETLKLFATPYPVDLGSMLLQEGGRGRWIKGQGTATELWRLMDMALTGRGSREKRPVQLPPEQEWTTVQRTFELRRGRG